MEKTQIIDTKRNDVPIVCRTAFRNSRWLVEVMENKRRKTAYMSHFKLTALGEKELVRRREHESGTVTRIENSTAKDESVKEIDMHAETTRNGQLSRSLFLSFILFAISLQWVSWLILLLFVYKNYFSDSFLVRSRNNVI